MGDAFNAAYAYEHPVHTVSLSPFYVSHYEIANGQYCEFLNSALSEGLITVANDAMCRSIDNPSVGRRFRPVTSEQDSDSLRYTEASQTASIIYLRRTGWMRCVQEAYAEERPCEF